MGLFVDTNFHLAVALVTGGIPLASHRGNPQTGEVYPAGKGDCFEWREISAKQLEEKGYATIEDAVEAGYIGTIAYGFLEHPDRKELIKGYREVLHGRPADEDTRVKIPDEVTFEENGEQITVRTALLLGRAFALYVHNMEWMAARRPKVSARLHLRNSNNHPVVLDPRDKDAAEKLNIE
jgi:hypothetical protein